MIPLCFPHSLYVICNDQIELTHFGDRISEVLEFSIIEVPEHRMSGLRNDIFVFISPLLTLKEVSRVLVQIFQICLQLAMIMRHIY